jgi:fused signal recognition particle receptor
MVFDWFRRKYNDAPADEPIEEAVESGTEAQDEAQAGPTDEAAKDAESAPEAGPDEDYLAWAKAAYQNIKTQAAVAVPEPVAPVEPIAEPEPVVSETIEPEPIEPEPVAAEVSEPEPVVAEAIEPEPVTPEAIEPAAVEPEPIELDVIEPQAIQPKSIEPEPIEPESVEPESIAPESIAPETSEAPALSFLARAQADREARMERLIATATDEPEPEEIDEEPIDPADLPTILFDEDFLWSAEVLASQGRRPDQVSAEEIDWLTKLRKGLGKTRLGLVNNLKAIVGQGPLNADAIDEIETLLLQADVGVEATDLIIEALQSKLREEALPPDRAIAYLKRLLREMLDAPIKDDPIPALVPIKDQLNIWLITGINGAGKTTTIGKLGNLAKRSDYRCLIAAADTFRAAAVQQVQVWGDRSGIEVICNPGANTDPAAVVFDGILAAQSRNTELLLVDTAGRLQNKKNLMDELAKIRRIIDKKAPGARIESLLVLDSSLGQNGLQQAKVFAEAANLTGVILTKLDGSGKGGVALAVVQQLGLPIRFIGAGEGISDLRPFSSYEFVEALLSS